MGANWDVAEVGDGERRRLLMTFLDAALGRSERHPERHTLLLRATAHGAAVGARDGEASAEVVDRELRRLVRRGDLVVRLLERTWVVVAEVSGAVEGGRLTARLRAALEVGPRDGAGTQVGAPVDLVDVLADPCRPPEDLLADLLTATPRPEATATPRRAGVAAVVPGQRRPGAGVAPRPQRPPARAWSVRDRSAGEGAAAHELLSRLRHEIRIELHRWHRVRLADLAELAVTELVTELAEAGPLGTGSPDVVVHLESRDAGEVHLEVRPVNAVRAPAGAWGGRTGHGLDLVRRFARRAGHHTSGDGVPHLWCHLSPPAG